MEYDVYLWPEKAGGYSVTVPALPGCYTQGADEDDALAQARDVIVGYLDVWGGPPSPVQVRKISV